MARLDKLQTRRIDTSVTTAGLLSEAYRHIQQSDSVRYVIGSMQPIDPEYTKNTYLQGDRVCNQLKSRISMTCQYRYQGSVTNDTHIKARSDIDALVLIGRFHTVQSPQQPQNPYQGDPLQDLIDLRSEAARELRLAFPEVDVDDSGSKAISLEGGSLTRKIDVVPANWYNTNDFARTNDDKYRGVEILDLHNRKRIANTPFLHNAKIDERDRQVAGNLRKVARLMKSIKYDTESVSLSSYDIVAIAYSIDIWELLVDARMELALLSVCLNHCRKLQQDAALRESLNVPDGHRKIFASGHADLAGLNQLAAELQRLSDDVLNENQRSFRRLEEARVEY